MEPRMTLPPVALYHAPPTEATAIRVALLAPYAGTNLGDAAIQAAAIENIRRRHPRGLISGITLNPQLTAERHGIPCFPIDARALEFASPLQGDREGCERASLGARARAFAKKVPVVGPALRVAARVLRTSRREVAHLVQGLRFARRLDAIIVAGSGQLDDEWGGAWAHPYALFKWALRASDAAQQGPLEQGVRVRNLPFTRDDRCWPDLAFSLPREEPRQSARRGNEGLRCVGVSPIAYGHPQHWPTADPPAHERYMRELTEFVAWLASQGRQVVLFATGGVDHLIVRDLLTRLGAG